MRFGGKIVLVVGGNSGIGLASARAFAAEGAEVIITGRDSATLDAAVASMGGRASAFRTDIADPDSLVPVAEAIRQRHGRLDVLFANAGIGVVAPVREITPQLWDQVHNINLRGCFFAVQRCLPLMGKGGAIIFNGSIGSVLALPGNTIYGAAKAGLRSVTRNLAAELVGDGIRVNMVSPGPIETPIISRNVGMSASEEEGFRAQLKAVVPMKRIGEPEEVARPVLFLASDDASFITGVELFVDGGCVEL